MDAGKRQRGLRAVLFAIPVVRDSRSMRQAQRFAFEI